MRPAGAVHHALPHTAPAVSLEIVEYGVVDAAVRPPAGAAVPRTVARRSPRAARARGVPFR
ncbi:hypothetical protein [Streptomyces sp. AF1B]|uniref:hypothetical protein n=1 Tax=Streptomyces sp. AF1B TaxID=3399503 RepID=UPI003AAD3818